MIDLDGIENKEKLGANAILAVSLANAKAAASLTQKIGSRLQLGGDDLFVKNTRILKQRL